MNGRCAGEYLVEGLCDDVRERYRKSNVPEVSIWFYDGRRH